MMRGAIKRHQGRSVETIQLEGPTCSTSMLDCFHDERGNQASSREIGRDHSVGGPYLLDEHARLFPCAVKLVEAPLTAAHCRSARALLAVWRRVR